MGDVFAGVHTSAGREVVLKVIRVDRFEERSLDATRAFELEAEAVGLMRHPGIIRIHDRGVLGHPLEVGAKRLPVGTPYIIMDRIHGAPLSREQRSWEDLCDILTPLLDALASAHARGVIHRDIKPENILVRASTGEPVLIDFGIARMFGSRSELSGGTLAYMAPEQFMLASEYGEGPWTDLFALGCLAFELFAGYLPFLATNQSDMLRQRITSERLELPEHLKTPALMRWFDRMLAGDPMARFSCAAEALVALLEIDPSAIVPHDGAGGAPAGGARKDSLFCLSTLFATSDFDAERALPISEVASLADARPLLPETWREGDMHAVEFEPMPGAGLGIFELQALPLLGRAKEQDLLWRALVDCAREGRAAGIALSGFAGLGKSRLARWLGQRAHELAGTPHVWITFEPMRDPVRSLAAGLESLFGLHDVRCQDTARARIARRIGGDEVAASAIAELIYPTSQNTPPTSQITHLLLSLFGRLTSRGPMILVLDDVDMHGFGVELVEAMAAAEFPLFIVCTSREERLQQDDAGRGRFEQIVNLLDASHLELLPMDEATQEALVSNILHIEREERDALLALTRGNPLHMIQLLGSWISRELIVDGAVGFRRVDKDAPLVLPDSIENICEQRLENATRHLPEALPLLESAALLGQSLTWREWDSLCESAEDEALSSRLLEAVIKGGLAERERDGWRFAHGLIRESLEQRIQGSPRWAIAHGRCFDVIGASPGSTCSTWRRAFRHALEAEDWDHAVDCLHQGLHDQTHASFLELYALLDARLPAERSPFIRSMMALARGSAFVSIADAEEANRCLDEAVEIALEHDLERVYFQACATRVTLVVLESEVDRGFELARELLEKLDRVEPDDPLFDRLLMNKAGVLGQLAELHLRVGDLDAALDTCARALDIARERLPYNEAWLEYTMASIYEGGRDWEACARHAERAEACFLEQGDLIGLASCHNLNGVVFYERDLLDEALECFAQSLHVYSTTGDAGYYITLENILRIQCELRRFEDARELYTETARALARDEAFETFFLDMDLLFAALDEDWTRYDALFADVDEQLDLELWAYEYLAIGFWGVIEVLLERGEHQRAREAFDPFLRLIDACGELNRIDRAHVSRFEQSIRTQPNGNSERC